MKIKVLQQELSQAIKKVKNACIKNNDKHVFQTIRLNAKGNTLTLTATRLDCTFESVIKADVKEEGEVYIYASKLDDIITKLDDCVIFETTDNSLKIKSGNSKFQINLFNLDKFPTLRAIEYEHCLEMDFKELKKAIKSTITSCSNLTGNIMSGVRFKFEENILKLGATNSYCLSHYEILCDCDFDFQTVIPKFILNEIISNDAEIVKIELAKQKARFTCDNETYETNILTGAFPLYEKIIPNNTKEAIVNKEALMRSIEKVMPLADYEKNIVKLSFQHNTLKLDCMNNDGISTDTIEIEYSDEPLTMAFDYKILLDGLKKSEKEEIVMSIEKPDIPITMDLGFLYLLAPLKTF